VTHRRFPSWLPFAGVVFLALAASISGLGNRFAQDDFALILRNPPVHNLWSSWQFFGKPYWPAPFVPDLYRPLALLSFAVQWAAGGGSPLVFRLFSYLLYAVVCTQVLRLARIRLDFPPAFAAAALFAVHPVHVEAVAMAVNQGELWVALLGCLMVITYIKARRPGEPVTGRTELFLGGLFLIACFFKENALVLPGLLVAAELLLVRTEDPWRARLPQVRRLFLLLVLVAVSFYGIRTLVLRGDLVGSFTAEGLAYLTMGQRALTMLSVVPHWFRLLLWPAHLQGDYSPSEIVGQTAWGPAQTTGLLLLLLAGLTAVWAWRRAPVIAFGLVWCAVALFPVHNVLVPTGIVLAERTLFLPSVGIVLAIGGAGGLLLRRASAIPQAGMVGLLGSLLILGVFRSTTRHPVWADQFTFWYHTANRDAPLSYRAHQAMAGIYWGVQLEGRAEREYRLAMALRPPWLMQVPVDYADRLRMKGFCHPAIPLYREALDEHPNYLNWRASLIACLLHVGQYKEARDLARIGVSYGLQVESWARIRQTADSALRAGAPPGSVKISLPGDSVGQNIGIGSSSP
jgi:hypothetical protein